jgi:hypothetical protein
MAPSDFTITSERWRQAVADGGRFLATWGGRAQALGWTARDLFGLHKPSENPHPTYRRLSRYDETGSLPATATCCGATSHGRTSLCRRISLPAGQAYTASIAA